MNACTHVGVDVTLYGVLSVCVCVCVCVCIVQCVKVHNCVSEWGGVGECT